MLNTKSNVVFQSMKRIALAISMLLMAAPFGNPARADLTHRMTSSTQLTVNGAYTDSSRIGSTYTVSGTNIKVTFTLIKLLESSYKQVILLDYKELLQYNNHQIHHVIYDLLWSF